MIEDLKKVQKVFKDIMDSSSHMVRLKLEPIEYWNILEKVINKLKETD